MKEIKFSPLEISLILDWYDFNKEWGNISSLCEKQLHKKLKNSLEDTAGGKSIPKPTKTIKSVSEFVETFGKDEKKDFKYASEVACGKYKKCPLVRVKKR